MKTVCLTENINWDMSQETAQDNLEKLQPYIGKRVIIWGGGGATASYAVLTNVSVDRSVLRQGGGFSISAAFRDMHPKVFDWQKDGVGTLYLGSWQISVEVGENETVKA